MWGSEPVALSCISGYQALYIKLSIRMNKFTSEVNPVIPLYDRCLIGSELMHLGGASAHIGRERVHVGSEPVALFCIPGYRLARTGCSRKCVRPDARPEGSSLHTRLIVGVPYFATSSSTSLATAAVALSASINTASRRTSLFAIVVHLRRTSLSDRRSRVHDLNVCTGQRPRPKSLCLVRFPPGTAIAD